MNVAASHEIVSVLYMGEKHLANAFYRVVTKRRRNKDGISLVERDLSAFVT